jgi:mono/diheme cytochrome c family protein
MKNRSSMFMIAVIAASALFGVGILPLTGTSFASGPPIPGFAVRSKIPISGKQGPPGRAAALIGDRKRGESLFTQNCQSCHGPQGKDNVSNPGSSDGTVPPLNPIDRDLANKKATVFAANIDRFIQHGSVPAGSNPVLFMPNWEEKLSQQEIADLEAYIMRLNRVTRKK